jgi:preprotein translocase subunit YajC
MIISNLAVFAAGLSLSDYLPFIVMIVGVFYFLNFRPQQKQMKETQAMLSSLKKGDEVLTQAGLIGKIFIIADKIVTLEIANGVKVRVLKTSIQGKLSTDGADSGKADSSKPSAESSVVKKDEKSA